MLTPCLSHCVQPVIDYGCKVSRKHGRFNCRDNAVIERFFLNLKMERVWQRTCANHAEATQNNVADHIVNSCAHERLHSTPGYRSPTQFERLAAEAMLNLPHVASVSRLASRHQVMQRVLDRCRTSCAGWRTAHPAAFRHKVWREPLPTPDAAMRNHCGSARYGARAAARPHCQAPRH